MSSYVAPEFKAERFNCPNCGAFAHQRWIYGQVWGFPGPAPTDPPLPNVSRGRGPSQQAISRFENANPEQVFSPHERAKYIQAKAEKRISSLTVVSFSTCESCKFSALWVYDEMVYPYRNIKNQTHLPSSYLNADERKDYMEALEVKDISPRAAGALLRGCLEKLLQRVLGNTLKIADNIKALQKEGKIPNHILKMLTYARVAGNDFSHSVSVIVDDDLQKVETILSVIRHFADEQERIEEAEALLAKVPEAKRGGIS